MAKSTQGASDACPACQHPLAHHDSPDCWECSNAGTVCDLAPEIQKMRVQIAFGIGPKDMQAASYDHG